MSAPVHDRVRISLGIADACESCRWLGPKAGAHNYCMHPSSNWSRGPDKEPEGYNTKWIGNARKDELAGGGYWDDQCGGAAMYWEPRDE